VVLRQNYSAELVYLFAIHIDWTCGNYIIPYHENKESRTLYS